MHLIQTPLLMIHAKDDPVVAYTNQNWEVTCSRFNASPYSQSMPHAPELTRIHPQVATENEHIIGLTTKRGGHVAFFQGWLPFGSTWSETVSMRYIAAVLEVNANLTFQLEAVAKMLSQCDEQESIAAARFLTDSGRPPVAPRRSFTGDSFNLTAPEVSRIASTSQQNLAGLLRVSSGEAVGWQGI